MKMIVRKAGYMFDKIWNPGESFEFNGPKSTWFAPEGEEPRAPVNVDAVQRPTQSLSPDEKDREIANLKQQLAERQGAPLVQTHPGQAERVPHGPVSAPRTADEQRREDEAARSHQPNNPTLTPEQRYDAQAEQQRTDAQLAKQKAEADQRAKEEAERRAKESKK